MVKSAYTEHQCPKGLIQQISTKLDARNSAGL